MLYTIDHDRQRVYRAVPHALTMRHTIAIEEAVMELQTRHEAAELSAVAMLSMTSFPNMRYGATWFSAPLPEGDVTEDALRDLDYVPTELTEDIFLDLTEVFVAQAVEAISKRNPHRDQRFEQLKKTLIALMQDSAKNLSASNDATPQAANTSVKRSSSSSRRNSKRKRTTTATS